MRKQLPILCNMNRSKNRLHAKFCILILDGCPDKKIISQGHEINVQFEIKVYDGF